MLAVTSETSPLAKSADFLEAFFMDDFIGGRYSSSSCVGAVVLSLAFGPEVFAAIMDGAAESDKLAKDPDIKKNAALLDALIGVYERNALGYLCTAVLPYSQALNRFPAHLQQLDMESNGKSVNRFGEPVNYSTGPVIFGEPGTNGQHSFYQLLHQGTDIVPMQFVGFKENQAGMDVVIQGSTSQKKLCANVAAQIMAFACGKADENPNKAFAGGRPSSIIAGKQLTPKSLGALLAHFENKVMFQGFIWNVNSFDQEGVQLGKLLAKRVLAHETDGALKAYADLFEI
jgi:glucose-6-phosphate isomerase